MIENERLADLYVYTWITDEDEDYEIQYAGLYEGGRKAWGVFYDSDYDGYAVFDEIPEDFCMSDYEGSIVCDDVQAEAGICISYFDSLYDAMKYLLDEEKITEEEIIEIYGNEGLIDADSAFEALDAGVPIEDILV